MSTLCSKLSEGLQSLTSLRELTIHEPTGVRRLPHVKAIKQLKILLLPQGCLDVWHWLSLVQGLQALEVTFRTKDSESSYRRKHDEFRLSGLTIKINRVTPDTMVVFENLPKNKLKQVSTLFV